MILQIERRWHRDPGWFYTLPRPHQIQLIADYRMCIESPKQAKERQDKAKRARLNKIKQKARRTGALDHGR